MRNYNKYRLPQDEYKRLRAFCKTEGSGPFVQSALFEEFREAPDALQWWIYQHVTRTDYNWAYMEAHQIPCSKATFYTYRWKFYWYLSQEVKKGKQQEENNVV